MSLAKTALAALQRQIKPLVLADAAHEEPGKHAGGPTPSAPLGPLRLHETQFFCREAISGKQLEPFDAVLDTGNASTTMISEDAAAQLMG